MVTDCHTSDIGHWFAMTACYFAACGRRHCRRLFYAQFSSPDGVYLHFSFVHGKIPKRFPERGQCHEAVLDAGDLNNSAGRGFLPSGGGGNRGHSGGYPEHRHLRRRLPDDGHGEPSAGGGHGQPDLSGAPGCQEHYPERLQCLRPADQLRPAGGSEPDQQGLCGRGLRAHRLYPAQGGEDYHHQSDPGGSEEGGSQAGTGTDGTAAFRLRLPGGSYEFHHHHAQQLHRTGSGLYQHLPPGEH